MLFTATCSGCHQPGTDLCHRCRFALASTSPLMIEGGPARGTVAALPYQGVARELVHGLKYRNRRVVARVLAAVMVRRLPRLPIDLVTWAPTGAARARRRGFDQAELLARAVARELGVPCRRLLYRSHGSAQTGADRATRLVGPSFRGRAPGGGLSVLLVDDVVTTGATLASARSALLEAGVAEVWCAAAAATPSERSSVRPVRQRPLRAA